MARAFGGQNRKRWDDGIYLSNLPILSSSKFISMSGRNPRRNRGGPSARSSLSTTSTGMPRNKFDKGVKYDPFSNAMTYGGGLASNFQGRENNRNRQGNNKSLERRLIQARKTGNLALPNQQFTSFPPEVRFMSVCLLSSFLFLYACVVFSLLCQVIMLKVSV